MSDWYKDYLRTPHWRETRARKAKAADYQCERCGEFGRRGPRRMIIGLHVHHLTYERVGKELDSDLEVLCIACHELEHGLGDGSERRREELRKQAGRRVTGWAVATYLPENVDIEIELAEWDKLIAEAEAV